ncbi:MAG: hypothetical protein KDD22_00540 [Bdellovibrionales bacterium]|nr:hypothetical protein [Bdellovibrionales bacterium]
MGRKNLWIIVGLLLMVALAVGGYYGFEKYHSRKEVTLACIATSFPYVLMEHKKSELQGMFDNMKLGSDEPENTKAASDDSKSKLPAKHFISPEIDERMLDLSEKIQGQGPGSVPPEEMMKYLMELEPLFRKQASEYLTECRGLFSEMVNECGSFEDAEESSFDCRAKYDDRVSQMLKSHIR